MGIVVAGVCGDGATSACILKGSRSDGRGGATSAQPEHDASNVQNLRDLSRRLRMPAVSTANEALRLFATSLGVTRAKLSWCSEGQPLLVPFGGFMLSEFEEHFNTFGNPIQAGASWTEAASAARHKVLGRHRARSLGSGFHHLVFPVSSVEAQAMGITEPQLIRVRSGGDSSDAAPNTTTCQLYVENVYNGWLSWILGEMGVAPRVRAIWTEEHVRERTSARGLRTASVVDRWPSLELSLANNVTIPEAMAPRLLSHFAFLTQNGLVTLDAKPRDMFARRAQDGSWDLRLGDLDLPVTGLLPGASAKCRLALSLQMAVVYFACSPLREHAMARRFVREALDEMQLDRGALESQPFNWTAEATKRCSAFGSDANSHAAPAYSTVAWSTAQSIFLDKPMLETRNVPLRVIMDGVVARGGTCPAKYCWSTYNGKQGRNPPSLNDP